MSFEVIKQVMESTPRRSLYYKYSKNKKPPRHRNKQMNPARRRITLNRIKHRYNKFQRWLNKNPGHWDTIEDSLRNLTEASVNVNSFIDIGTFKP